MNRQVQFSREELFERVWETPVLRLAREIGVSDVALAKACRYAKIPLPARGHWAIPPERRPNRPKLPNAPEGRPEIVQFSIFSQRPSPPPCQEPSVRIDVPASLESVHPLVARTIKAVKHSKPQDGRIRPAVADSLDIGVSPQQIDRALRIFDALIKASEAKGIRWEIGSAGTHAVCDNEKIGIRLWEVLTKKTVPPPPKRGQSDDYAYYPGYEWASTGRLSIQSEDHVENAARRNWAGTESTPLEEKLHEVLAGLPLIAEGIRLARDKREAWKREWDASEARRRDAARNEEIQRRLRSRLVHSLESWERARRLRAFCSATRERLEPLTGEARQQAENWLGWAEAHADALDPLARISEISDMQMELEGWYHNEYQRPAPDWWTTKPDR